MVILGIDPGSRKAGYAVIKVVGRKVEYLASGALRYDKTPEFLDRLGLIYQSVRELCQKYSPDEVALESLIYVKSIPALSKLAQARGAMIAAMSETCLGKIYEYSPNLVKSSVTGHGHAAKEGVEKSLQMIFGSQLDFKTSDESDALAIAVCHFLSRDAKKLGGTTSGKRTLKSVFSGRA